MIHNLKCWPEFFQAIKDGRKTFEIRLYDRDYSVGDFLELHEWDPETESFTSSQPIIKEVTYLFADTRFLQRGYICLGLKMNAKPDKDMAIVDLDTLFYGHQMRDLLVLAELAKQYGHSPKSLSEAFQMGLEEAQALLSTRLENLFRLNPMLPMTEEKDAHAD